MSLIRKAGLFAIPLAFCFLWDNPTLARWAKHADAGAIVNQYTSRYKIRADGTYIRTTEVEVEILREDARVTEGLVRFKYTPDSETFRVIEAYTKNENKRDLVPSDSIEDKPLASEGEGFDQINQISIAFPDVRIGSKIYYKVEREHKVALVDGFFSDLLFFGGEYYKAIKIQMESELPLYADLNDTNRSFQLSKSRHSVQLKNRRPVHFKVIDENEMILNPRSHPWILVSTADRWKDFAKPIIAEHEDILSAPLPRIFQRILEQAKARTKVEDQMNFVTSELANHLRYHGDWRSVRGRNIPRPFAVVAKTLFADCKDFAAVTTALFRKLGIQADMAWVNRSLEPDYTPEELPHIFFNHAIVRASYQGKTYWVDPTNVASFAHGVFEDIIDRPAFVLNPERPRIEEIPPATPETSAIEEYQELTFEFQPKVKGRIKFSGREANFQAGLARESSAESLRHYFIDLISRDIPVINWQIQNLNLRDRITKDFDLPFEYSPKLNTISTTAGTGFKLPTPRKISGLFDLRSDRVSDYFIAQPVTLISEVRLMNVKIVGDSKLNCQIDSPWMTARRNFEKTSNNATVSDRVLILKPTLSPKEISSNAFLEFQQKLIQCFRSNILIFK